MKKETTEKLDKTIHEVKFLIADIVKERKEHHKKLDILMRKHDIKINKMIKKGLKLINDLYDLFTDLEEGEKGEWVDEQGNKATLEK